MENEPNKPRKRRLTLKDCLQDWTHCPYFDGEKEIYESLTPDEVEEMRKNSFSYSVCDRIYSDMCYDYFMFDYNNDKIHQYMEEHKWSEHDVQFEGLVKMFNDGWLKSPAYVDWKEEMYFAIEPRLIENLLRSIDNPSMRVQILQFIVDNAEYLLDESDIDQLPYYEYLLSVHRIDAQISLQDREYEESLKYTKPQAGDYNAIRKYLEAKLKTDPAFQHYYKAHPLKDVCEKLKAELHIDINDDSLRKNINRHQNRLKMAQKDKRTE